MGSMSENEIKPVAVLCETAAGRYWSTNVAVHCLPLGDYYDQSAIDRLTAERDAAVADSTRLRTVIECALAQHNYGAHPRQNHWAAKAMSELAAIDAARLERGA